MHDRPASTTDLLHRYREVLIEMDANRVEHGGDRRRWNRLVDQMQSLHLALSETPEGRDGITELTQDENPTVRQWSAGNALAWDPASARPVLERMTQEDGGAAGFEAGVILREYDAGRLNTAWKPKDRHRS